MTKTYDWPLPFLILPKSPRTVDVILDPMPEQKVVHEDVVGVGAVEVRLGGAHWDVEAGRADSVADKLPSYLSGVITTPSEENFRIS